MAHADVAGEGGNEVCTVRVGASRSGVGGDMEDTDDDDDDAVVADVVEVAGGSEDVTLGWVTLEAHLEQCSRPGVSSAVHPQDSGGVWDNVMHRHAGASVDDACVWPVLGVQQVAVDCGEEATCPEVGEYPHDESLAYVLEGEEGWPVSSTAMDCRDVGAGVAMDVSASHPDVGVGGTACMEAGSEEVQHDLFGAGSDAAAPSYGDGGGARAAGNVGEGAVEFPQHLGELKRRRVDDATADCGGKRQRVWADEVSGWGGVPLGKHSLRCPVRLLWCTDAWDNATESQWGVIPR